MHLDKLSRSHSDLYSYVNRDLVRWRLAMEQVRHCLAAIALSQPIGRLTSEEIAIRMAECHDLLSEALNDEFAS